MPDKGLQGLLPRKYRGQNAIFYSLMRRASIKDIIETLHIPHTEVATILLERQEITFNHIPQPGEQFTLSSFTPAADWTRPTVLRPEPLPEIKFMVDINVGKLARLLRMLGADTLYEPKVNEATLARQAAAANRILLSRNRALLQRKIITWGHLVRAEQPETQLHEIITLYNLQGAFKPFSRCLHCNTHLKPVEKTAVFHLLEPLTRKYYQRFHRCPSCERIYWQGSHHKRMEKILLKQTLPGYY